MKKVIIALVILAVIIVGGVLENHYVDKLFDTLNAKLDNLQTLIEDENETAFDYVCELQNWWEHERNLAELFLYQPDIRAFSVALGETKGSIECGDFQNALSKVASLKVMSDNIHDILDFNIKDII